MGAARLPVLTDPTAPVQCAPLHAVLPARCCAARQIAARRALGAHAHPTTQSVREMLRPCLRCGDGEQTAALLGVRLPAVPTATPALHVATSRPLAPERTCCEPGCERSAPRGTGRRCPPCAARVMPSTVARLARQATRLARRCAVAGCANPPARVYHGARSTRPDEVDLCAPCRLVRFVERGKSGRGRPAKAGAL